MNDGIGSRPRLNWNSTTDSGGNAPPRRPDDGGGFAFNLGNALAKLGLDPDEPVADRVAASVWPPQAASTSAIDVLAPLDTPRINTAQVDTARPDHQLPPLQRRDRNDAGPPPAATMHVADDLLPRRGSVVPEPSPPAEPTPASVDAVADSPSRSYVAPRRSVFDDVVSPSPQLPPTVLSPPINPVPRQMAPTIMPTGGPQLTSPGASVAAVPASTAPAPAPVMPGATGPILPTLPAAVPVSMPAIATPVDDSNNHADIRALRSAQIRASRQQRNGRVVGRAFLVLVLLGGLIGAALLFGRDFLFPTAWDSALTPIVDQVEQERGEPFDHTVGLVAQTEADFDRTVLRLTIGESWTGRVPEWRALGLATGNPTVESIATTTSAGHLAVYDPTTDRIYMPDTAAPNGASTGESTDMSTAALVDLRLALEQAYDAQLGVTTAVEPVQSSLAGVSAMPVIARRAVDLYLVDGQSATTPGWLPTGGVPAPIEYELLAADVLGAAVLDAVGIEPSDARFGTDLSTVLGVILDDGAQPAEAGALHVGERSLADPVALGNDDWSLVWGMRLPPETVDQLATLVRADSYRPIDRNGVTCVVGVFEAATAPEADVVLLAITNWVGASPLESQATATRLSETRVQLVTCDPGPNIAPAPNAGSIVALVERQLARLSRGS